MRYLSALLLIGLVGCASIPPPQSPPMSPIAANVTALSKFLGHKESFCTGDTPNDALPGSTFYMRGGDGYLVILLLAPVQVRFVVDMPLENNVVRLTITHQISESVKEEVELTDSAMSVFKDLAVHARNCALSSYERDRA